MCGDHAHHKNDKVDRKTWYLQMQTSNKFTTGFVDYATARILVSLTKDSIAKMITTDVHRPKDKVNRVLCSFQLKGSFQKELDINCFEYIYKKNQKKWEMIKLKIRQI
jgi:hypothetical protein